MIRFLRNKDQVDNRNIGILYICTGEYIVFWKKFYESCEKNFLRGFRKEYYVFTDAPHIANEEFTNVHRIFQNKLPWPYITLKRFDIFLRVASELEGCEYTFFFNANCYINKRIYPGGILPNDEEELIVASHPGMVFKPNTEYTYERNAASRASIPMGEGQVYVMGAFNGGRTAAYLKMARCLSERIKQDESDGVIAIYHDESHLNRYIYERKTYKLVDAGYVYPEGWRIPFRKRILLLDKSKYFNDQQLKADGNQRIENWYQKQDK